MEVVVVVVCNGSNARVMGSKSWRFGCAGNEVESMEDVERERLGGLQ